MRQHESTVFDITIPVADGHVTLEADVLVSGRYAVGDSIEYVHATPHFNRLFLVTTGCCSIRMGEVSLELTAGMSCLLPVWRGFRSGYSGGTEFVYFHVELLDALGLDVFRQCSTPVCLENAAEHPIITNGYPGADPWQQLEIRASVLALLARCCAASVPASVLDVHTDPESPYADLMRRLRANPTATLTVSALADEMGMSRHALSRGFSRATGMPLKQYLDTLLMERALRLLATTKRTHADIAQALGFRDAAYFHRVFKRHYGESPGAFRDKLERGPHEPVFEAPEGPVRLGR